MNKREKIVNTIAELRHDYSLLTCYGKIKNIKELFGIDDTEIYLSHINEEGKVINKLIFFVKRKKKKKMNMNLLQKKLPYELCMKIMEEYFSEYNCLAFEIDIEYDLLNYPSKSPRLKLKNVSNNGFKEDTEKEIKKIVNLHNLYLVEWNSYISLVDELNFFISELKKVKLE